MHDIKCALGSTTTNRHTQFYPAFIFIRNPSFSVSLENASVVKKLSKKHHVSEGMRVICFLSHLGLLLYTLPAGKPVINKTFVPASNLYSNLSETWPWYI